MTNIIRIEDLAKPVLNQHQQAVLDYCGTLDVVLTPQSILAEATRKMGLSDFGDEDFRARLERLCSEWSSDPGLTKLSQLSLRNKLLRHAKNRLLIEDFLRRHPDVHSVEIQAPIIAAGLPRSGTTHLLNLMAVDTRLRALPLWESYEPVPLSSEVMGVEVDTDSSLCKMRATMADDATNVAVVSGVAAMARHLFARGPNTAL